MRTLNSSEKSTRDEGEDETSRPSADRHSQPSEETEKERWVGEHRHSQSQPRLLTEGYTYNPFSRCRVLGPIASLPLSPGGQVMTGS